MHTRGIANEQRFLYSIFGAWVILDFVEVGDNAEG